MKSRKARTVTLVSVLVGTVLFALVALTSEESIRERWWRWNLRSADLPVSRRAARKLVKIAEARASRDFERGDHAGVLRWLLGLESLFRKTGGTEIEITYLIAECHFRLRDYEEALPYYRNVLELLPDAPLERAITKRLYTIGQDFLRGDARLKSGVPVAESRRFGVNLLIGTDGLLTRYPFLFEADSTLLDIADLYFDAGAYDAAEEFYLRVFRDSHSDRREEAQFGAAVAYYKHMGGPRADPDKLAHAGSRFERYCRDHTTGSGERIERARRYLHEIEEARFGHSPGARIERARRYLHETEEAGFGRIKMAPLDRNR